MISFFTTVVQLTFSMRQRALVQKQCSYPYIHNAMYQYKQRHGIRKATLNILSKKWKPAQMMRVFSNLMLLFSTQCWPSPKTDLYTSVLRLSKIHNKRIQNTSAIAIQRAYLRHLYNPTHEWHVRRFNHVFHHFT